MTEDKLKERKERVLKILKILHGLFPEAKTELNYSSSWELLVAVQLSAQSTDVQVNKVTEKLFKKYPKFEDYLKVDQIEFEKEISSVNFYRNKARNILAAARALNELALRSSASPAGLKSKNILAAKQLESRIKNQESGDLQNLLPDTMEELLKLPGVARKTGNVILGQIFKKAEGIVVDTHIMRLSQKFDLTDNKEPVKIERDLMEIVPREEWIFFGNALVWYGRRVCKAREHECDEHDLTKIFPKAGRTWPKK